MANDMATKRALDRGGYFVIHFVEWFNKKVLDNEIHDKYNLNKSLNGNTI